MPQSFFLGGGLIYRYPGPLRRKQQQDVQMIFGNILGNGVEHLLAMHTHLSMGDPHLIGTKSSSLLWVVCKGGSFNGNEWTSSINSTFLQPESVPHCAQLAHNTVFISLYVVPLVLILLSLPPPNSSKNMCHHHIIFPSNTYGINSVS